MSFSDRSRIENAAYLVPETLKGKNVAYLLSDRSRALAQAYVLKKVRRHSFLISKIYSSYGKIKLYARPKITTTEPHGGGGGLAGN